MDRLETQIEGQADVIKIDLLSEVGRTAAQRYHITFIPALLLFDGDGKIILQQQGTLDTQAVRSRIEQLYEP